MTAPLEVGLVGAGPWAAMVHAPVLAAGPETRLAGVWNRTEASARSLAATHKVPAFETFDALLDACEAVAFCVAPEAQPDLAVKAARAGKAVLLEKPLGVGVEGAKRIAEAVAEAGVGSIVVLSYRFSDGVREFLETARAFDAKGGRACFLSGAFLGGPFAMGWRLERGCLLDIGPHIIDLVDAALGPITEVRAHGDVHAWVGLMLDHESGARSEVSLCARAAIEPSKTEIELYGPGGSLVLDARAATGPRAFRTIRREFVETARAGGGHPLDAARGLYLQRLLAAAEADLKRGAP